MLSSCGPGCALRRAILAPTCAAPPRPLLPRLRLNEEPTVHTTLADLTCDSDGKIDAFPNPKVRPAHAPVWPVVLRRRPEPGGAGPGLRICRAPPIKLLCLSACACASPSCFLSSRPRLDITPQRPQAGPLQLRPLAGRRAAQGAAAARGGGGAALLPGPLPHRRLPGGGAGGWPGGGRGRAAWVGPSAPAVGQFIGAHRPARAWEPLHNAQPARFPP